MIGRDFSYPLLRAVCGIDEASLQAALDRLAEADILLVQGQIYPDSDYRFKHALIQSAAYENLLRSRRQLLHRRVAESLLDKVAGPGAPEPELLAYHFSQAGLAEAAIESSGRTAGQQSLQRSALVEAAAQFTRALDQIATLPSTSALRREHIKLQVAVVPPLIHVKGYAAPETKAAVERARLLIEQAEIARRSPRRPVAAVLSPLRILGRTVRRFRWQCDARACDGIPVARGETIDPGTAYGRASKHGCHPTTHRRN